MKSQKPVFKEFEPFRRELAEDQSTFVEAFAVVVVIDVAAVAVVAAVLIVVIVDVAFAVIAEVVFAQSWSLR